MKNWGAGGELVGERGVRNPTQWCDVRKGSLMVSCAETALDYMDSIDLKTCPVFQEAMPRMIRELDLNIDVVSECLSKPLPREQRGKQGFVTPVLSTEAANVKNHHYTQPRR